jgi:hypothetical protein
MKAGHRALLFVCCALMSRTGYALVSNVAAGQSTASSTTATNNHSAHDAYTSLPDESKNRIIGAHDPMRASPTSGKIPLPKPVSPAKANRLNGVRNNISPRPQSPIASPQRTPIKPAGNGKAVANRNFPTQPSPGSAISGGQFKNPHSAPISGVIGGPAKTTRNTPILSGTDMGRKGVN